MKHCYIFNDELTKLYFLLKVGTIVNSSNTVAVEKVDKKLNNQFYNVATRVRHKTLDQ